MDRSLTAVRFDMLLLANKNMKHYKRTWYNYPRGAEAGWLKKWFRRKIGLSWLDDNRGILKKGGWVQRWQTPKRGDGGILHGSEARGQFSWQTVCALSSRGITVFRGVYDTARRFFKPPKPPTATRPVVPIDPEIPPRKPGETDFQDPEFRKRKGLKPLPLRKAERF